MYTGNMKTPVLRFKNVNFIKPDGTIDQDRSYSCKLLIDESDESVTKYEDRMVKILKTINYNDGCTETIKIHKGDMNNGKTARFRDKTVEFEYPNGTIDKDRSYKCRKLNDKSGESDAE